MSSSIDLRILTPLCFGSQKLDSHSKVIVLESLYILFFEGSLYLYSFERSFYFCLCYKIRFTESFVGKAMYILKMVFVVTFLVSYSSNPDGYLFYDSLPLISNPKGLLNRIHNVIFKKCQYFQFLR